MSESEAPGLNETMVEFLERAPLYMPTRLCAAPRRVLNLHNANAWPEALSLRCPTCSKVTSWNRVKSLPPPTDVPYDLGDRTFFLLYMCALCRNERWRFLVAVKYVSEGVCTARKVGQFPSWSIALPDDVRRSVPEPALGFYKHGVICLSQGYGVGAAAYFRRVVEEVVSVLLDLIAQNASVDPEHPDVSTIAKVEAARANHQAEDKLRLAAEAIPEYLRRGGKNPLKHLYDAYSECVHSRSDEDSARRAVEMRAALDYVLPALHDQFERARAYHVLFTKPARELGRGAASPEPERADAPPAPDEAPPS